MAERAPRASEEDSDDSERSDSDGGGGGGSDDEGDGGQTGTSGQLGPADFKSDLTAPDTAFCVMPSAFCVDGLHPITCTHCLHRVASVGVSLGGVGMHTYTTPAELARGVLDCLYRYKTASPPTTAKIPNTIWGPLARSALALLTQPPP